jgi:hypothetical protein
MEVRMPEFYNQEEDREPVPAHPFPAGFPITADYRDLGPTGECVCGSDGFYILAMFDLDRTIGGYFTDGLCAECGALVKVPTEADDEQFTKPIEFEDLIEPPLNLEGFDALD